MEIQIKKNLFSFKLINPDSSVHSFVELKDINVLVEDDLNMLFDVKSTNIQGSAELTLRNLFWKYFNVTASIKGINIAALSYFSMNRSYIDSISGANMLKSNEVANVPVDFKQFNGNENWFYETINPRVLPYYFDKIKNSLCVFMNIYNYEIPTSYKTFIQIEEFCKIEVMTGRIRASAGNYKTLDPDFFNQAPILILIDRNKQQIKISNIEREITYTFDVVIPETTITPKALCINGDAQFYLNEYYINKFVNLTPTTNWTAGQGTIDGFNQNGSTAENTRELGIGPFGIEEMLWVCRNNDTVSDADGGWEKVMSVDSTKDYISVVFFKIKNTGGDGRFYHGCEGNTVTAAITGEQANTDASNPYFNHPLVNLFTANKWYVSIGFINASNKTSNYIDKGGIYDLDTKQRIYSATSYKFNNGVSIGKQRVYKYYDTTANTEMCFASPIFTVYDGTENTLTVEQILSKDYNKVYKKLIRESLFNTTDFSGSKMSVCDVLMAYNMDSDLLKGLSAFRIKRTIDFRTLTLSSIVSDLTDSKIRFDIKGWGRTAPPVTNPTDNIHNLMAIDVAPGTGLKYGISFGGAPTDTCNNPFFYFKRGSRKVDLIIETLFENRADSNSYHFIRFFDDKETNLAVFAEYDTSYEGKNYCTLETYDQENANTIVQRITEFGNPGRVLGRWITTIISIDLINNSISITFDGITVVKTFKNITRNIHGISLQRHGWWDHHNVIRSLDVTY